MEIIGEKFGRWTVLKNAGKNKYGALLVDCECECGVRKKIRGSHLTAGKILSCGCYQEEEKIKRMTIHGHTIGGHTDEYRIWAKMRVRCTDKNSPDYHNYGGRGIIICKEWENYINFYNDMGERPSKEHSIDRIDNDKGYFPGNCKWSTKKEQANNRRTNIYYEFEGERLTLGQWAAIAGIKYATLYRRLTIMKWPIDKALTIPLRYA